MQSFPNVVTFGVEVIADFDCVARLLLIQVFIHT